MMKHVSCTHIETKVPLNGLVQQRQEEIGSIGSREVSWDPSYHLEDGAGSKLAELLQLADCED